MSLYHPHIALAESVRTWESGEEIEDHDAVLPGPTVGLVAVPREGPGGAAVATSSTASFGRSALPTTVPKPGFAACVALPLIPTEPDRTAAGTPALRNVADTGQWA